MSDFIKSLPKPYQKAATLSQTEALALYESSLQGLTQTEAQKRLKIYGLNQIVKGTKGVWQILLRQFHSSFVYLLFGAALLTFILGEYVDSGLICAFILINTVLGFSQEYHSEKTLKILQKYTQTHIKAWRSGQLMEILTEDLVP